MIKASIDIGSNSILLLVAEVENNKIKNVLRSESAIAGLGRDLDLNQAFIEEAMKDALAIFKDYRKITDQFQIDPGQVIVTATEAARVAKNALDFFSLVKKQTGFAAQIISGEDEAYYSMKGIMAGIHFSSPQAVIVDIGGASTEIIKVETQSQKVIISKSLPIGSVRATNWLARKDIAYQFKKIENEYMDFFKQVQSPLIYCVAGTATSIVNMYLNNQSFDEQEINGQSLSYENVMSVFNRYQRWQPEEILEEFPFLGKRARAIHGGLEIMRFIMENLKAQKAIISTYGLKYGTLLAEIINPRS